MPPIPAILTTGGEIARFFEAPMVKNFPVLHIELYEYVTNLRSI